MKILSAAQIRELDKYTIEHEPVSSIDLMERAADAYCEAVEKQINPVQNILVFCGMGNNGGDGLAVARKLLHRGFNHVSAYVVSHSLKGSVDFYTNEERLKEIASIQFIETEKQIPVIATDTVVIDAIFGSGLSRPVEGISAAVTKAN